MPAIRIEAKRMLKKAEMFIHEFCNGLSECATLPNKMIGPVGKFGDHVFFVVAKIEGTECRELCDLTVKPQSQKSAAGE